MFLTFRRYFKAFTLIELLVVVVIIGVLASLVMIGLNTSRSKARDAKRVADVRQIQNALEMYFSGNSAYPAYLTPGQALIDTAGTTYMNKVPNNATPSSDGPCAANEYIYSTNTIGYALNYCLGSAVNDVPAGNATAGPGGIAQFSDYTTNLASDWKFEGDYTDSVGGVNGSMVGSLTFTAGKRGQALHFVAASNNYVTIANPTPASLETAGWTVMILAKPVSTGASHSAYVFCSMYDWNSIAALWISDNGSAFLTAGSSGYSSNGDDALGVTPAASDNWHVFTARKTANGNFSVFIDGVLDKTVVNSHAQYYRAGYKTTIGTCWHAGNGIQNSNNFKGDIDDVRYYNVDLTDGQIKRVSDYLLR
ncbi:MAG: LamG-like jellyroll fold domain-containing protein [Candidatus Falkowbacteria bacterium]